MGGCASKPHEGLDRPALYREQQPSPPIAASAGAGDQSQPAVLVQRADGEPAGPNSPVPTTPAFPHVSQPPSLAPSPSIDEAALWAGAATFGSKTSDMWGNLQRACDWMVQTSPALAISVAILSNSRKFAKVICSTGSPHASLSKRGELCNISDIPSVLQVASTCQPNLMRVKDVHTYPGARLPSDYQLLADEAGCTSFVTIPLIYARQVLGTLMLAGKDEGDPGWPNRWVASFWPWVAMYLTEVNAVRLVNLLEKIQTAPSLNNLAWVVISELDTWFEWCHADDTEARLVLLSEDRPNALVLSRSVTTNKSDNLDSPLASGTARLMTTNPGAPPVIPPNIPPSDHSHLAPDGVGTLHRTGSTSAAAGAGAQGGPGAPGTAGTPAVGGTGTGTGSHSPPVPGSPVGVGAARSASAPANWAQPGGSAFAAAAAAAVAGAPLPAPVQGVTSQPQQQFPLPGVPGQLAGGTTATPLTAVPPHVFAAVQQGIGSGSTAGGGANTAGGSTGAGGSVGARPQHGLSSIQRGLSSTLSAKGTLEEGLLGTQMSLVNTLTRRCLAEGSKLLFVADVMAALRKYSEPWKDIFLDQAYVTNPVWVIAAPVMADGKHLAAIIWLSSSRLSPAMLAQGAKTSVPPLLHAVAERLQGYLSQALQRVRSAGGNVGGLEEGPQGLWSYMLSATQQDSTAMMMNTAQTSVSSLAVALDSTMDFEYRPVKYSIARTDSASTSALMRMYQTAIAQHQRASTASIGDQMQGGYEEIEVIAKAGQGAFGSVYVAMWKGLVVAVKVMKQQLEGRRAMRTAWELAVTKSLQHVNVVSVHAVLTDVLVEKRSKRIIRFVPSMQAVDASSVTSYGSGVNIVPMHQPGDGEKEQPQAKVQVCQVIIMEYCNLGPLHHYMAERRFVRQLQIDPSQPSGSSVGGAGPPVQGPAGNAPPTAAPRPPLAPDRATPGGLPGVSSSPSMPPAGAAAAAAAGGAAALSRTAPDLWAQQPEVQWVSTMQVDMPMIVITLAEVAEALIYLHASGFIHCDLKPENILLKVAPGDPRGFTAKVSDFGLSDLSTSDGPLMGELGGTVTHIAPEIVTQRKVTRMCDVYSFGIIMWELYSGQRPYLELLQSTRDKRARDKLILSKVAHENMRPEFPASAPEDYMGLARRCWAQDPLSRPAFQEILAELRSMQERYGAVQPAPGGPPSAPGSTAGGSVAGVPHAAQQQQQNQAPQLPPAAYLAAHPAPSPPPGPHPLPRPGHMA